MIWAIELGNTRNKRTRFSPHGEQLGETEFFKLDDWSWLDSMAEGVELRIVNTAQRFVPEDLSTAVLTQDSPWPMTWQAAPTIGLDRCLAVLGARRLHPVGDLAVISCGTCLTGTLLDAANTLRGGPISHGWTMRLEAMAAGARVLPRLSPESLPFSPHWYDHDRVEHAARGVSWNAGRNAVLDCFMAPIIPRRGDLFNGMVWLGFC